MSSLFFEDLREYNKQDEQCFLGMLSQCTHFVKIIIGAAFVMGFISVLISAYLKQKCCNEIHLPTPPSEESSSTEDEDEYLRHRIYHFDLQANLKPAMLNVPMRPFVLPANRPTLTSLRPDQE